jgi:S-adenosylmethionine decarboxylase
MAKRLENKLKLHGFNNLTKSLSFNIYDICYARTGDQHKEYIEYIDEAYNAERLTNILSEVANIIGATVLNVARQDYEPQGASVTMLICEEPIVDHESEVQKASVVGHLDKSHITVHTYPETHPDNGISTFRADIDVSTCGLISPLRALNYLINSFESDIVIMDYRVRGFTRNVKGRKHFYDHKINSIQEFLQRDIKERYDIIDVNVYQENIFHSKMRLRDLDMDTYMLGTDDAPMTAADERKIRRSVEHEILEIFYGRNMPH